jgi:hypothetical protein
MCSWVKVAYYLAIGSSLDFAKMTDRLSASCSAFAMALVFVHTVYSCGRTLLRMAGSSW